MINRETIILAVLAAIWIALLWDSGGEPLPPPVLEPISGTPMPAM
jgi:hypothetical protein